MPDLLVKLYELPSIPSIAGVTIRRALAPERHVVLDWVAHFFYPAWHSECAVAFSQSPISCIIAVEEQKLLGFACYDTTTRNFFGPTGVDPDCRGRGVGTALLVAALDAMKQLGYGYAIVGDAGPVEFYQRTVGAIVIPDSTPGGVSWDVARGRMSSLRFENATIYTPELSAVRSLAIADGHVAEAAPTAPCYDLTDLIVVPGLIDLQLNGAFGHDFTSDPNTIGAVAAGLPQYGVTAFLPTIITSPLSQVAAAQQVVQQGNFAGSRVLGLHLEGPFLNPAKRGAHNPSHLQNPSLAAIETWSPANGVRLVTLAPELDAAYELIRALIERGVVVSAGHSEATFEEAEAGFNQGIRAVTHLFNAMPALHHREPGLAGAALSDQRITMGLIPDGVHVHAGLVRHIWHSASQRIAIVSDAQAALGMPDGEYLLGDTTLTVANGEARRSDGRLAGSVLAMDQALRNIQAWTNSPLEQILPAFTTIPANLLGLAHYGRIAINNPADLVIFDQQYHVVATIVGGNIVYGSTTLEQRQC